jgi:hypothetical protein
MEIDFLMRHAQTYLKMIELKKLFQFQLFCVMKMDLLKSRFIMKQMMDPLIMCP